MRRIFRFIAGVVVVLAAIWLVRPAGIGDPAGTIALIDRTFPAAAALRTQYYPWADKAAVAADGKADGKSGGQGGAKDPNRDQVANAASGSGKGSGGKGGPLVVVTKAAERKAIPVIFTGVGTVQSMASIAIRPHADGQVMDVPVAEGAKVKQGDVLFRLDDRSLTAQMAQADAQILKDQTQLEQNQRDLARAQDLLKQKFVTPQSIETAQTSLNQTKAQIAVDTAARAGIQTSLSFTTITAPVSGRIGSIAAKSGSFARAGDVLATVNQIDPIYVTFALPQVRLAELRAAMAKDSASVRVKDTPDAPAGKIAFIENTVDATTGTVQVKAAMQNTTEALWPGAFAPVELQTGVDNDAIVVPSVAVLIGQRGPYVYTVVNTKAALKAVTIARTAGNETVVTAGLSVGDDVVVQGQGALTDGADVRMAKDPAQKKDSTLKTSSADVAKDG
jgi:membrane fusion protein, multidrug efflux system